MATPSDLRFNNYSETLDINFIILKVKDFVTNEERQGLVVQANPDIMEEVGEPFDLTNVQYFIGTDSNTENPIPPLIPPARESQTIEEAFSALSNEHDLALETIKKQRTDLSQARARILQLEDQIASGLKYR